MIKEEKKQKIIKYYLEVKSIKKVMDKFLVSKPTIYKILEDFEIPKPSKMRKDELDEELDPEPFLDVEGNKSNKLMFNISGKQKKTKDDLGDNIEKMVKYTRGLVQYAKNIKEFADIMREIDNEKRETQQINKLIQNTDILDFLKPKIDKLNQSNFETENKAEKSIIDNQFLMILFNPSIPSNLKMNMIYIKMFEIVSKMDFNFKVNPQQVKDFMNKFNHSSKNVNNISIWKENNEEKA